ncbi:hypothetical protein PHMEG_00026194 [Phytophthora megakarya]|uniref:Uncharacterized protein n=1 Tax=Phytophthora megakarya TaxID=4795 RepID=A0A225VAZ6_9STRA|nr:hypothetical protein PHMEG_00026194 [Phytophthora megakarya]
MNDYTLLPSYLDVFSKTNSESHVSCQLDASRRFLRAFLLLGPVVTKQIAFLPVLQIDGIHRKNNNYNGVCLTLVELDGNHQVIPMAVGGGVKGKLTFRITR